MVLSYEETRAKMLKARALNTYTKVREQKPRGPVITRKKMRRAIRGSFGIKARVARRLDVGVCAVTRVLQQPGWEDLAELFSQEADRIIDESEKTIMYLVRQREDFGTAFQAAKLVLQSKGGERGWKREVTIQGGDNPIRVEQAIVNLDALDLPLDVRKRILETIEVPGGEELPQLAHIQDVRDPKTITVSPIPRKTLRVRRIEEG